MEAPPDSAKLVEAVASGVREVLLKYAKWSMGKVVDIALSKLADEAIESLPYRGIEVDGGFRQQVIYILLNCGLKYRLAVKEGVNGRWRLRFSNNAKEWNKVLYKFLPCVEDGLKQLAER